MARTSSSVPWWGPVWSTSAARTASGTGIDASNSANGCPIRRSSSENTPQMNTSPRWSSSALWRTSSSISSPRRTAANITGFMFGSLLADASSSASQRFSRW